ncbi:MAG TPA: UDP-2,3-diacylglucosamine diphosphatase [Gammaproteobacteria bacterium]|nr:UDP-2,3-diacylglucosamine diphosphatase [Gammaproteobacteria bacterium]
MSVTLFISDLHLSPENPAMTDCFVRFLKREAANADGLYILGDLFEAWIGDDVQDDFTHTVTNALKSWPKPLYLMQGNRDFLMGEKFAQKVNATLLSDPTVIDLYGNSTLVSHGDLLCTDDVSYLRFRKIVHIKLLQKLFLYLPLSLRLKIAAKLRSKSSSHVKTLSPEIMDVTPRAVAEWLAQYGVSSIIHGHTHRPGIHFERKVLPAWHGRGGALVVNSAGSSELVYFD